MAHVANPGLMKDPWRIIAIIFVAVVMMLLICMKAAGWLESPKGITTEHISAPAITKDAR